MPTLTSTPLQAVYVCFLQRLVLWYLWYKLLLDPQKGRRFKIQEGLFSFQPCTQNTVQ